MRKLLAVILVLCFSLQNVQTAIAETVSQNPPVVSAQAAILMDAATGETLFEQNANQQLAMASTTKIMTAILALEKGNLDAEVTVSPTVMDRKTVYGTRFYLEPGEKMTLRNLLYALLLLSANDAAVAIAEHVGGSVDNFVQMMNEKAKELGATNTNFMNPHGLTQQGHYSSARDMALFARYALQNPTFAQIVRTKQAEVPRSKPELPTKLDNINHMLWLYDGIDGVKTGYTAEAGNCVVESATRNGRQLIVVILKAGAAKAMYKDAEKLFDYGFSNFGDKQLAAKGQILDSVALPGGATLKLTVNKDVFGTVRVGDPGDFTLKPKAENLTLPVEQGQARGELEIYKQGKLVQTVPLVAAEKVGIPLSVPAKAKSNAEWIILIILSAIVLIIVMPGFRRKRRRSVIRRRQYGYYQD